MSDETPATNNTPIDSRIKSAQRKGAGVYILSGLLTVLVLVAVFAWLFFIKGYALVIGPAEASPTSKVSVVSGLAWLNDRQLYTLGGSVELRVEADTFEPTTVVIDSQSPTTIEIVLKPSPAQIIAVAKVNNTELTPTHAKYLEQTEWLINNKITHVGAKFEHSLAPGEYELTARNPYFESVSQRLSLTRGSQHDLPIKLVEIQGSMSLASIPSGVNVLINGVNEGRTPLKVSLNSGDYAVEIQSERYQSVNETISLTSINTDPTRNYRLLPKQAQLVLNVTPSGGVLLVDNIEQQPGSMNVSANKSHQIRYTKPGHTSFRKTVDVAIGERKTIDIELKPQYGELLISSNVPAALSINGKPTTTLAANTPSASRLLTVPQTIALSAQGYRSVSKTITPVANKQTPLNIRLLTEFEARRAEGLPLFISKLGISMLRFRGNAFVMGSPPNETGRRRNEHQVNVDFSRQFWLSTTEITQAQYNAFLQANGSGNAAFTNSRLPITDVSWLQAAQFCNWLSVQEGLPVFYRFVNGRYAGFNAKSTGYRLPTEAEWEWTAKKAKRSTSTKYVWGNHEKLRREQGNFADKSASSNQLIVLSDYDDGKAGVADVASFRADRAGLYDLDGNVSEWVNDFYTTSLPDSNKQHIDYLGANKGDTHVVKGGNFETGRMRDLRAAFREFSASAKPTVGFRIARYQN